MPRKGRNEEIVHALHQVDGGEKVAEVCRRLGVSEQTFYRSKKQFAGLGVQELAAVRVRFGLSTTDGALTSRRLARQCEARVSTVWPRRARGSHESPQEARESRAGATAATRATE